MRLSLTSQPAQRWMGSKVSDACSETPHKTYSHSFSVPEISGMINICGIPVETAVKLQRPYSIPHAKIHRQPWPFCASAANGTLSSRVSKLKDQRGFVGIKLLWRTLYLPLSRSLSRLLSVTVCPRLSFMKVKLKNSWWGGGGQGREKGEKQSRGETQREQVKSSSELNNKWQKMRGILSARIKREKGFHSLVNIAHSRGGEAVYSISKASVSVYVCLCVWLGNREVTKALQRQWWLKS